MTSTDVLVLLLPADPDSVRLLRAGTSSVAALWSARWSPLGVPSLDRLVIESHDGIEIIGDWYEPDYLPGWQAVDFVVGRYL